MASEAAKRAVRDLFFAVDDDERAGVIRRVIDAETAELRELLAEVGTPGDGRCHYCHRILTKFHAPDCLITRIREKLESMK